MNSFLILGIEEEKLKGKEIEKDEYRELLFHKGFFISKHWPSDHTWENRCGEILTGETTLDILQSLKVNFFENHYS